MGKDQASIGSTPRPCREATGTGIYRVPLLMTAEAEWVVGHIKGSQGREHDAIRVEDMCGTILLYTDKRQYLLTSQVSRYCLLSLHRTVAILLHNNVNTVIQIYFLVLLITPSFWIDAETNFIGSTRTILYLFLFQIFMYSEKVNFQQKPRLIKTKQSYFPCLCFVKIVNINVSRLSCV